MKNNPSMYIHNRLRLEPPTNLTLPSQTHEAERQSSRERPDKQRVTNSHGRRRRSTVKAEVSNSRSLGSVSAAAKIRPPGQMPQPPQQQEARNSSISRRATSSTPPPPPLLLLLAIPHSNAVLLPDEEDARRKVLFGPREEFLVYSAPRNPTDLPLFFYRSRCVAAAFQDGWDDEFACPRIGS